MKEYEKNINIIINTSNLHIKNPLALDIVKEAAERLGVEINDLNDIRNFLECRNDDLLAEIVKMKKEKGEGLRDENTKPNR